MEKKNIYKCAVKEGFYVYSSSGCGNECAIRLENI